VQRTPKGVFCALETAFQIRSKKTALSFCVVRAAVGHRSDIGVPDRQAGQTSAQCIAQGTKAWR
jgi:hypothetical protein